ncbi:uncharacterized protein LOC113513781 isoform X2 [Galleria mellonella]|uniref:Uncharacterized protein LOC113513781 isoform X2 n=1 Tax=Galleria mellonella TaxID=7137 RepID=A0ABM3M9Q9_GALME|nr:uncharacterized protein LOC113513781 isoform X2 [Galleria mellonella]
MLFNNLMEGEAITTNNIISSIKKFNTDGKIEHGSIKAIFKTFVSPENDRMAIKENQSNSDKYVYTVPVTSPISPVNERAKMINEAKLAFLNSTVNSSPLPKIVTKKVEPTIHYAQLAIAKGSEDTRSTGGGRKIQQMADMKDKDVTTVPLGISYNTKKKMEQQQQRKVSFKIKTASNSYRRPPLATKTMTITSSNVSELTKKFNSLVTDENSGPIKQSKLAKTIEDLQMVSRCPASNSSTPSSTLSSSPNIKIVVRQRRGSKKRNNKKRCSSVDSIDKLLLSDNSSTKIRVIRSKSDGTKIPKSPKKRSKFQDSNKENSGSDSVDGSPSKINVSEPKKHIEIPQNSGVKSVIKKFECEITAQLISNASTRLKDQTKSTIPTKEKPKVPEKKSSLVLTKNIVVKDGIPKIKTIKTIQQAPDNNLSISIQDNNKNHSTDLTKKKEPLYDKKKFKTNYIHSEKLPLKVVEIIQEDINENNISNSEDQQKTSITKCKEKIYEEVNSNITPNQSFLWRRKSSTFSESDKSISDGSYIYGFANITKSDVTVDSIDDTQEISTNKDESQKSENVESQKTDEEKVETNSNWNSDFESNLVEAYNKEVLVGYTTAKPKKDLVPENDYELLEPKDATNVVVIPIKNVDKPSKINCPLPEIPKINPESPVESEKNVLEQAKENIYQCLLELRSHPEGDECSLHNYELCDSKMEERTRGDGDSDDGYEYCKSPIKPYCVTSSSGIQIAENYQPSEDNSKNYAISKSVSGTSTVSYERIGPERIYEKIPVQMPKSKDSSPTYSSRHSFVSSDYTGYNESENIYDTIKHSDATSLSHCYESIPNSPSMVKLRNNIKKQLSSGIQKRLSFDTVSTNSHCTISSEQRTNSIYGQRSVLSYNGQEIAFQVPSSETSVSDRSDDWVDISDEEKTDEQKIIIVQEISRGRKSPVSWSQKVRHQWQKSPIQGNEQKDCDSSDSGHLYESLEPPAQAAMPHPPLPLDDDFDSFDSDSDDDYDTHKSTQAPPTLPASRLPSPPTERGQYTLTKIASAAQRKMRQIKRNLTKKYIVAMDGKSLTKTFTNNQNNTYDTTKKTKTPIYANCEKPEIQHVYSNVNFTDSRPVLHKTENPVIKVNGTFKEELKTVIGEKRLSNGDVPPPLPDKPPPEKPTTPTSENSKKDTGTLSRKTYFSFKSRFRRASSLAVDINTDVPSALKITNSTFYLTDSMDGDSGFSNCDGQPGSTETLSPGGASGTSGVGRRRDGRTRPWAESSPCLALERPGVPPPPPPGPHPATDLSAVNEELKRLLPTLSRKDKGPRTRTSWYAGCGADTPSVNTSTASWYAEVGLYQAGNISTSSGASSGSHPASPLPHSLFTHEPLYQFYNAAKVESVCRETGDSDSDAYEVNAGASAGARVAAEADTTAEASAGAGAATTARPSAMALVAPRGPARTLWCEVPEVVNSTVLSSLAPAQKRLQEAKFELLTSEASYLNSLNVLEAHFIAHPAFRDTHVLPAEDFDTLFSTILPVRKCSQLLMNELEKCWQENILLQGICDIVLQHAEEHFHVYVKYCENQALMVKALQRLREQPAFSAALKKLESHPACQSLSLHSFLMLPMQRVTRLPLLLDAVLKNLHADDQEYQSCMHALATLNNFVSQCNEGARNTERVEEMFRVSRTLQFAPHVRSPPQLAPACGRRDRRPVRWLVRSGEMTQIVWKSDESKLTFGKKFHKVPLYVFLFNDLLVVAKKTGEESYLGIDHCPRSLLEVCEEGPAAAKHSLLLTLLENHEGRTVEMLVSCPSETAARRWAEALLPAPAAPGEALYAGWDCPQVAALYAYTPAQPDELQLAEGDVVNVTRKTSEGWYYGERTRDGEAGWFPGAYTAEIASPHVRARHLRQRYRLLALSSSYGGHRRRQH